MFKKLKKRFSHQSKFEIHPLFLVLGFVMAMCGRLEYFIVYSLSALLHELAHLIVSENRGYKMTNVRLMPFGAELFGDLDNLFFKDEIAISLAGPLLNFCISIVCLALWWVEPMIYQYTDIVFSCNLSLCFFNLLPIFPLDGGRILLAVLSRKINRSKASKLLKNCAIGFSLFLMLLFFVSIFNTINFSMLIMSIFLISNSLFSTNKEVYERIDIKNQFLTKINELAIFFVPKSKKLYELSKLHQRRKIIKYVVIDDCGNPKFELLETEISSYMIKYGPDEIVGNLVIDKIVK